jgi:hypothetical protein
VDGTFNGSQRCIADDFPRPERMAREAALMRLS